MELPTLTCATDSNEYERLYQAAADTLTVPGASLELGVREGGSTELILRASHAYGISRPHVAVDPWGSLPYIFNKTCHGVYPDDMRRRALASLFVIAKDLDRDLLAFVMKDSDFFRAFADGVPFYHDGNAHPITSYSLVFFDAEHTVDAIMAQVEWCAPRTSIGGQWVFDDVPSYDHVLVEQRILNVGFTTIHPGGMKAVYKKEQ